MCCGVLGKVANKAFNKVTDNGVTNWVEDSIVKPLEDIPDKAGVFFDDLGDLGTDLYHGDWGKVGDDLVDCTKSFADLYYTVYYETWVEILAGVFGIKDEDVAVGSITQQRLVNDDQLENYMVDYLKYTTDNTCGVNKSFGSSQALRRTQVQRSMYGKIKSKIRLMKDTNLMKKQLRVLNSSILDDATLKTHIKKVLKITDDITIVGSIIGMPTPLEMVLHAFTVDPKYEYDLGNTDVLYINDVNSHGILEIIDSKDYNKGITVRLGYIDSDTNEEVETSIINVPSLRYAESYSIVRYEVNKKRYVYCLHSSFTSNYEGMSILDGKAINLGVMPPIVPLRVNSKNMNNVEDSVYITAYEDIEANSTNADPSSYNIKGEKYLYDENGVQTDDIDEALYGKDTAYNQIDTFLKSINLSADKLLEGVVKAPADTLNRVTDAFVSFQIDPLDGSDSVNNYVYIFAAAFHKLAPKEQDTEHIGYGGKTTTTKGRDNAKEVKYSTNIASYNNILAFTSVVVVKTKDIDTNKKDGDVTITKVSNNLVICKKVSNVLEITYTWESPVSTTVLSRSGKSTVCSMSLVDLKDNTENLGTGKFMIPFNLGLISKFKSSYVEELTIKSIYLEIYSVDIQEVPYYANKKFVDFLEIAGLIITIGLTIYFGFEGFTVGTAIGIAIGELAKYAGRTYAAHLMSEQAKKDAQIKDKMTKLSDELEKALENKLGADAKIDTTELAEIIFEQIAIEFTIEDQIDIATGEANYIGDPQWNISSKFCLDEKLKLKFNGV